MPTPKKARKIELLPGGTLGGGYVYEERMQGIDEDVALKVSRKNITGFKMWEEE